jgi:hypothetical protein
MRYGPSSEDLALLNELAAEGVDLKELHELAHDNKSGELHARLQDVGEEYQKMGRRLKIERALLDSTEADLLICDGKAPPEQIAASNDTHYRAAAGPARPAGMPTAEIDSDEDADGDADGPTAAPSAAETAGPAAGEGSDDDASEDDGPIDWSKSDFYLEAEALSISSRRTAPPPPPPVPQWWVVSYERLAVRERPSRASKALDVMRKAAVLNVADKPPTYETVGNGAWLKLAPSELQFLCSRGKAKEAWVLVEDDKLGTLLTHVPQTALEAVEKDGEPLFDEAVHPQRRAAASAEKVAQLMKIIEEEEAQRKAAEERRVAEAQRRAAREAEYAAADRKAEAEAQGGAEANPNASYDAGAGPARPAAPAGAKGEPSVASMPLDAARMSSRARGGIEADEAAPPRRSADPGDVEYDPNAVAEEAPPSAPPQAVVSYEAAAGPARPAWLAARSGDASDSDEADDETTAAAPTPAGGPQPVAAA